MLPRVKADRVAFPLAVLLSLILAGPAAAAVDWNTQVVDFKFTPAAHKINVGDTVTWDFAVNGHTTASLSGQPDSWKSIDSGANPAGTSFTHQFDTPGKYQYVCLQHQNFMKGTIEVGTDKVIDTLDNFKTKRAGHRVRIGFKLNEPATVSYRLKGPSGKRVKKGRLAAGRHSFTVKRLKRGTYRGVLTVVDDFDKKITPRNHFVIR
jgi:plastocyanin